MSANNEGHNYIKIISGVNFINILFAPFLYESLFSANSLA